MKRWSSIPASHTHVGVLKAQSEKSHLHGLCWSAAAWSRKRDSSSHAFCILSNSRCRWSAAALLSASAVRYLSHSLQQTISTARGASAAGKYELCQLFSSQRQEHAPLYVGIRTPCVQQTLKRGGAVCFRRWSSLLAWSRSKG